ncbi:MAG TPA: MBL fold metallo-hydrolase [Methylomirabilota bacterium]|jgi:ribonuclease BN (tRNA processing enzyme)|nr:MBL fold metallo-hydrolase [Methylomirabilota bacterium]
MRITILGAGDAFCSGGRRHSSYLVESGDTTFLLDCGATTLLALKALNLRADTLDFVAISHLHGDHFGGLPFLFLEYLYERPRTRPLIIAGPPGLKDRVWALHRAMYRELSERPLCFPLEFRELQPGQAQAVGGVEVFPFRVPHQEKDISLGYRIATDGKSLLYSGDCGWNEDLVHYSRGVDLFICECCYFHSQTTFHISYPTIAAESRRLGCKRLLLSHLGREVLERLNEVTLECAHDGLVIEV